MTRTERHFSLFPNVQMLYPDRYSERGAVSTTKTNILIKYTKLIILWITNMYFGFDKFQKTWNSNCYWL